MTPEEAERSQKPYRYGMILLCFGALINWVGLAENYTDPFRYAGVACIIGGALLICTAMCCWLHVPNRSAVGISDVSLQLSYDQPPQNQCNQNLHVSAGDARNESHTICWMCRACKLNFKRNPNRPITIKRMRGN